MRLTKHRKTILSLLKEKKRPLSAELIYQLLPKNTMDLSTIYRNLELLYNKNYLSKSILEQTTYYHYNFSQHHHYMICLNCRKMVEVDCHLSDNLKVSKNNFKIISHDLTFYGYCENCQTNLKK